MVFIENVQNMHDSLIKKNFGKFSNYFDLCYKYYNKSTPSEIERCFCETLGKDKKFLLETESGYQELLDAICSDARKKQLKNIIINVVITVAFLVLAIKFWNYTLALLLIVFYTKALGLSHI